MERHPATARSAGLHLAELDDEWYPNNPPSTMYQLMQNACEAAGFRPRIRQVVAESAALVALVAADMGVALVPASLRHLKINGAICRPLSTPRVTTGLALAYRDGTVSPLVRRFLETARAVVRSREAVETPAQAPLTEDDRFTIGL